MGIRVRLCSDWCLRIGGHLVRLSANICQLHRPNTIPIFCAAVCRDYRLRTFIGFNPKLLLYYQYLFFFLRCLVSQYAHSTYKNQSDEVRQAARYQKGKSSNDAEDSLPPLHVAEYEAA